MPTVLRLLILEDEPSDAELEVAVLEDIGYRCIWDRVETRKDFLEHLHEEDYDLIISDYNLPSFDGLTALDLVLKRKVDLPFILVSGTLGEEAAIESLKRGATDYVLKSRLSRLPPVVRRALQEQQERRERQRADEALRANEEHLRTTLRSIGDAVISTDTNGCVTNMNPVAEKLTGWTLPEARGRNLTDVFQIVNEHNRQPIDNPVKEVLQSGQIILLEGQSLLISRNKQEIPVADSAAPISNEAGEIFGVVVVFRDQTKERSDRNKLEESQRLLRSIIDTIPSHVWWKDTNGHFLGANMHYAQDLGVEVPYALIGKSTHDLFTKEQADHHLADDLDVINSGTGKLGFEECIIRPDKTLQWLETNKVPLRNKEGKIIGIVGTAQDITDRKESEKKLLRLSTAIEQSPETIMITDSQGIIQYVNPAFETITGYSREEAINNTSNMISSGEQDNAFYKHLWKTISSGKIWANRIINKRKDGTLYTEEASIAPVKDAQGIITNYVAVKRDISDELLREQKLRQSQKMEAIGLLAGGIAHDFNNILQAILSFSELLTCEMTTEETKQEYALGIKKSALKAVGLTKQLLTFGHKKPVDRQLLDINSSIHDAMSLIDILLGEQYKVVLTLADGLPKIQGDSGELTQMIMNMAVNARDAMPTGGKLTISTQKVTLTESDIISIPEGRLGQFICLSISDTGAGIKKELISRLFEPFFTTKEIGKGTGLGLSVVYGIMKQSNGWINVNSEQGHGTEFKLYFPASEAT